MATKRTTKVATVGKKVVSKGKGLQRKAGTTARNLKKKATSTAAVARRTVKKVVKKAKPSAAVRKAGQLGRAVGGLIGKAIRTAKTLVPDVVKK